MFFHYLKSLENSFLHINVKEKKINKQNRIQFKITFAISLQK